MMNFYVVFQIEQFVWFAHVYMYIVCPQSAQ